MHLITSIATSLLSFGISAEVVQYRSSVDDFRLNKSIEVTLRMQVVLLNKSIGVRLLNLSIEFRDLGIWLPVLTMLPIQTVGSINSLQTDAYLSDTLRVFHFADGESSRTTGHPTEVLVRLLVRIHWGSVL